jgi:diphthamide synthase (EF-2-diphthine--ammonia ligase)
MCTHNSKYLHQMIDQKFEIIIVSVSAMGLERQWLGSILDNVKVKNLVDDLDKEKAREILHDVLTEDYSKPRTKNKS